MASTIRNAEEDMAALRADLATLQHDVAALVKNAASGLRNDGVGALNNIDGIARQMLDRAASQGESAAKAVGSKIEEKPVLTLLILLAASYAAGRLLMR